jgi:DNA polymerase-1
MSTNRPLLLVVDGNSAAHRAWHGYQRTGMTGPDGAPTHCLHGFCVIVAGIVSKLPRVPDGIIFAFDGDENVRRAEWPDYKANRADKQPDLIRQISLLPQLMALSGFCVEQPKYWEADDVCASAAATAAEAGWECIIATSDRDAFALIDDTTRVLRLGNGIDSAVLVDIDQLVADQGVRPDQYLSYAALRGDTSDNLPGVPGVGPKTAAKIVAAGAVADIAADPDSYSAAIGANVAKKVAEHFSVWDHNMDVMAPNRGLTLDLGAVTLEAFDIERVAETFAPYGITAAVRRLADALAGNHRGAPHTDDAPPPLEEPPEWLDAPSVDIGHDAADAASPELEPEPAGVTVAAGTATADVAPVAARTGGSDGDSVLRLF